MRREIWPNADCAYAAQMQGRHETSDSIIRYDHMYRLSGCVDRHIPKSRSRGVQPIANNQAQILH
jgi:hypothetical protein